MELRVADYIKAYTTTGRPPAPCPPLPLHPADRIQAGLPPLFQPYVEVDGKPFTEDSLVLSLQLNSSTGPPPQDVTALPDVQIFSPTSDVNEAGQAVHLQSITTQSVYRGFSFEELRYQAYRLGKKIVPEAIPSTPVPTLLITPPSLSSSSGPTSDQYQSITCAPPFDKHSFEELHLAYRRTGRAVTSEQIIAARIV
ncbi:hypothetical protein BDW22DRAFT_1356049 [Trametopsis cervina]|nr:hypothetical protein BDW22DRAFT_1356049 [Trametopsis cervina]